MKDILKNLGLLSIIVGVLILSISVWTENQSNGKLLASLILVVFGFFGHILLNRYID